MARDVALGVSAAIGSQGGEPQSSKSASKGAVKGGKGSSEGGGRGGSGGGAGDPSAAFMSATELAARLQGFRVHVWNQLKRLDGTVPLRPIEIPDDLKDIYRCEHVYKDQHLLPLTHPSSSLIPFAVPV